MNLFSTYRIIPAADIIKANIRPNHISDDVRGLINALEPVSIISKSGLQKAANLHRNVIQKLDTKSLTLDLLKHFGYRDNGGGHYVYQSTSSDDEIVAREKAANEFHRFYNDLKKIKDNSLNGFSEFINNASKRSYARVEDDDDDDENYHYQAQQQQRPQSSTSFRTSSPSYSSPPPMPSFTKVKEDNEKTSQTIRSFKESIVIRHGGRPAHSFIRRKLLFILLKQKYPQLVDCDDDTIDGLIDQKVESLKQNDRGQHISTGYEVYYECLIRANFDEQIALEMLREDRPNLKPPPEPVIPRGPTTTTIDNSANRLLQYWMLINEDRAAQMMLHEGDEWKNATHIVTAIIELRRQYNNDEVNDRIFSKMHRLIYSELSNIIHQLSTVKCELLAYALCKVSPESLEYLNVVDIRDIMNCCSNTSIRDDFQDNAIKLLSLDCPICGSSFPRSRMETMFLCNHMCCLSCAKQYYRNTVKEIKDSQSLNRLTCFEEPHPITDDVRLNFFQYLGLKLNQWFTDERLILETYHENLFIATRDSQIKKCGNQRCAGFFDINNNNRVVRARCPHCRFEQCQQCCRKWHDEHNGKTCEEYSDWLRENDPDDPEVQLTKYLNTAGMVCPNERCKAIYEYQAGGCEHFKCPACNTEFCRICSALFCNRTAVCPQPNCGQNGTLHAHCYLNCFREIRDAPVDQIIRLLTAHNTNVAEELQQKPIAIGLACPVEGCKRAPSITCENRFCEQCYKQFLCLFVWRNEIEPWELYEDTNLRLKLTNATVAVPAQATRPALIALAQQHLTRFLGKPKKIPRIRQ